MFSSFDVIKNQRFFVATQNLQYFPFNGSSITRTIKYSEMAEIILSANQRRILKSINQFSGGFT